MTCVRSGEGGAVPKYFFSSGEGSLLRTRQWTDGAMLAWLCVPRVMMLMLAECDRCWAPCKATDLR